MVKRILESGIEFPGYGLQGYPTFESNIDFEIRFMADFNITGCNWIEIPSGVYKLRDKNEYMSRCQLEIDVQCKDIVSHPAEGEWIKIAPLRILSFDIECAGRKGVFPEPEKDSVIQIANMVIRQGDKDPFIRNIFTLNTCSAIVGSQVLSYMKEDQMLTAWSDFVREVDPDLITGYNIKNFDIPYLLNRAKALKADLLPYLGRLKNIKTEKNVVLKQKGRREYKKINMEGRVIFDLIQVMRRDYKLKSYSLNAVSYQFLQEQKEDVHFSIISDLQNGNEQTRRRLAVYCLKDAYLPLRLIDKLMCIINYIQMARVQRMSLGYLLSPENKVVKTKLRFSPIERNLQDMDTSDLYEGGRSSSSKSILADFCDEYGYDYSRRSSDPNAYDWSAAMFRTILICDEFYKRNGDPGSARLLAEPSKEDLLLAKTTVLTDPLTKKIPNLTLRAREYWFKKIQDVLKENCDLFAHRKSSLDFEFSETKMCVEFEYDQVKKSKNLSIYQANCYKKIKELKGYTSENKFYLEEYKRLTEAINTNKPEEVDDTVNIDNFDASESSDMTTTKLNNFTKLYDEKKKLLGGFSKQLTKEDDLREDNEKLTVKSRKLVFKPDIEMLENNTTNIDLKQIDSVKANRIEIGEYQSDNSKEKQMPTLLKEKVSVDVKKEVNHIPHLTLETVSAMVVKELTVLYTAGRIINKVNHIRHNFGIIKKQNILFRRIKL